MEYPVKTIKELCSFSNGHGFTPRDWSKVGMPIIRIAHLNGSRRFDYYSGEPEPGWVVEPGELLFAWAGTKGVSFGPNIWSGPRGLLNQHIYRVRPERDIDATWLYYALLRVTQRIERRAHGFKSTLLHVRKSHIENQRCPVPPLDAQRRVVDLLRTAEETCDRLRDLIRSKRILVHGLSQQLLSGQTRFPEFKQRPWRNELLGNFFTEKSVTNTDRTVDLIYSCTKTVGIIPQAERFGKRLASADLGRYKVVEPGDLVYDPMLLWDGSLGFVPSLRGVVSPAYETFSVREDVNPNYFRALLKSHDLIFRYKQISQGTNTRRRKAHPRDFLRMAVAMPPTREEQNKIASLLMAARQEITLLVLLREQFGALKRGLMFRLLSGEISLS